MAGGVTVLGQDGVKEPVRDVGIFGLLQATREIANVHLIFGNEFMVTALRYPFSVNDPSSQNLVEGERKNLEMAAHQYSLAVDALLYTLNFRLDESTGDQIANHFTDRDFQTFAAASEQLVQAQSELAKRDRLLGSDTASSTGAALRRLEFFVGAAYTTGGVSLACFLGALAYFTRRTSPTPATPQPAALE